jgi:hypothetical protein
MTAHGWTATADALPEDGARVLAFVPGNRVLLPGKEAMEDREVLVLRFHRDFFAGQPEKAAAHGVHFWSGEGTSNRYFAEVSHWRPVPAPPDPAH